VVLAIVTSVVVAACRSAQSAPLAADCGIPGTSVRAE
jgi:hypothetical protein